MSRSAVIFLISASGVIFLSLALAVSSWWVQRELRAPYYGAQEPEAFVAIPKGAGTSEIADLLFNKGIIRYKLPFSLYARWTGLTRRLKAGEYRFNAPADPRQIADRLVAGDIYSVSVTIPEGLTVEQTIDVIAKSGLATPQTLREAVGHTEWIRDLDPNASSLEGYLFPATYRFPRSVRADDILKRMLAQFRSSLDHIQKEIPKRGNDLRRTVILASMIEKEVKRPEERPLVASVLVNRLEKGIPLACDPTVLYALKLAGRNDGNIRKADLAIASPYNTYVHRGLPPGPIANPGKDSLRAALAPAQTDYFYYVSRNDGTHQFSTNFGAHIEAVNRYQKAPRRKPGTARGKN